MTPHLAAATIMAAPHTSVREAVVFWVLAPIAVLAALGMVATARTVHSALLLAVDMLVLAAFYAVQDAPFLAFVQVVVYTGAIMMLFLFVLMLVGVDSSDSLVETLRGQRIAAILVGVGFAVLVIGGIGHAVTSMTVSGLHAANTAQNGNIPGLAQLLFTRYVFAFEVTSALLITAALGAMVLTHRERLTPKLGQFELMKRRFSGPHPTPLPGPGVYSRHDAVDAPAMLPDGTASPLSVSEVVAASSARRFPEPAEIGLGEGEEPR